MRLAKHLAHAGVASRRAAEALIGEGRVLVDGEIVTDPARDVGEANRVEVDGRTLAGAEPRVVYAVNKPLGVISTARDTHGRPTVVELVPSRGSSSGGSSSRGSSSGGSSSGGSSLRGPSSGGSSSGGLSSRRSSPGGLPLRLYPVGRLDVDSSGLILLTNDGELANRLTHPRHEVPKTYIARVNGGRVSDGAIRALRRGVELDDGPTAPAQARRVKPDLIELTIHEGRNRQVRRMCEAVGHPVLALERVAFGPLRLNGLAPGAHRKLSDAEIGRLRAL